MQTIIVDDDPWVLADIKASFPFQEMGFRVAHECADAESAYHRIAETKPDLIITDIKMGRMSGLDLMRKCRDEDIQSQFVILSGYDQFEYAQFAIVLGAFRYMLKPIDLDEAREVLGSLRKKLVGAKKPVETTEDQSNFQHLLHYIEERYMDPITLGDLSGKFFLNRTYICDLFRKRMDSTLVQYVNQVRARNAAWLLTNTELDIGHIAQRVGFLDSRYFSRVFKRQYMVTPVAYRKKATPH